MSFENEPLPYAFGGPAGGGLIRAVPEDFRVDEIPVVEPEGTGEHILLEIEKRGTNTDWVAKLLARHAAVRPVDVSYAGLKDRHAVTRQWFSVRLAGRPEPDWTALEDDTLRILRSGRHSRKLRTGALRGNRFALWVRGFDGDPGLLGSRIEAIAREGIPNYFGPQRFGRGGANLERALELFAGRLRRCSRAKRGIYLSAARSHLFNRVVAQRLALGGWNRLYDGECFQLDGSRSTFLAEGIDDVLRERFSRGDIHPTAPLWGRGPGLSGGEVARMEERALEALGVWREGLERAGLGMERRALWAPVSGLEWAMEGADLLLEFTLPKGCYATALLRECVDFREAPPSPSPDGEPVAG
ncbi:MAG: tRNA pseudouridine(13) synthase TruD [Candidatus Sedimenticola endophacoides]